MKALHRARFENSKLSREKERKPRAIFGLSQSQRFFTSLSMGSSGLQHFRPPYQRLLIEDSHQIALGYYMAGTKDIKEVAREFFGENNTNNVRKEFKYTERTETWEAVYKVSTRKLCLVQESSRPTDGAGQRNASSKNGTDHKGCSHHGSKHIKPALKHHGHHGSKDIKPTVMSAVKHDHHGSKDIKDVKPAVKHHGHHGAVKHHGHHGSKDIEDAKHHGAVKHHGHHGSKDIKDVKHHGHHGAVKHHGHHGSKDIKPPVKPVVKHHGP